MWAGEHSGNTRDFISKEEHPAHLISELPGRAGLLRETVQGELSAVIMPSGLAHPGPPGSGRGGRPLSSRDLWIPS